MESYERGTKYEIIAPPLTWAVIIVLMYAMMRAGEKTVHQLIRRKMVSCPEIANLFCVVAFFIFLLSFTLSEM